MNGTRDRCLSCVYCPWLDEPQTPGSTCEKPAGVLSRSPGLYVCRVWISRCCCSVSVSLDGKRFRQGLFGSYSERR